MTIRSLACGILALVAMTSVGHADRLSETWQDQRDYFNDYTNRVCRGEKAAFQILHEAALNDMQPVAIHNLGWLYLAGAACPNSPVAPDPEFARQLYRDSANLFYPVAMYNYGRMVFYGRNGEPQRPTDGLSWLESAAMEGMAAAAEELALIYAEGRGGVVPDFGPADHYYTLAERNGLPADRLRTLASALDAAAEGDATPPQGVAGASAGAGGGAAASNQVAASGGESGRYGGPRGDVSDPGPFAVQDGAGERSWSTYMGVYVGGIPLDAAFDLEERRGEDCGLGSFIQTDPRAREISCGGHTSEVVLFRVQGDPSGCRPGVYMSSQGPRYYALVYRITNMTRGEAERLADWARREMETLPISSRQGIVYVASNPAWVADAMERRILEAENSFGTAAHPLRYTASWVDHLTYYQQHGCSGIEYLDGYLGGRVGGN